MKLGTFYEILQKPLLLNDGLYDLYLCVPLYLHAVYARDQMNAACRRV